MSKMSRVNISWQTYNPTSHILLMVATLWSGRLEIR